MIDRRPIEDAIFLSALDLPEPAARKEFLDRACAGDASLRSAVEAMLADHEKAINFFDQSKGAFQGVSAEWLGQSTGVEVLDAVVADEQVGKRIGPYKILQCLGEGGWGVVYMAEQERPIRRRVAFKIIKLGMDTKNVIARFEAERQALALMDHSNIAQMLDAGATETGRPYFVMELVRGVKITDYCDQNDLGMRERLELFIKVCHAIQHAHQKSVIHRDIKPSNILVTLHDGAPVPKVIDFGIAKAIEGKLTEQTMFTAYEQVIGTPAYMSPEQAEMSGLDVDTRSDIYSLGVLLYELLTGRTPFDGKELVKDGVDKMRRTLREQEPLRPSGILTTLHGTELRATALHRHADPPKLISLLKGDLDWVVMKALEKDRSRRYETANGLAMDVQRYLNDEAVLARPPSRLYRLQKLIRRNKTTFIAVAAVTVTLIAGFGTSTWLFFRERESRIAQMQLRQEAEAARADAERARANEIQLRQEAEARERVTQATVLVEHGKMQEADDLLAHVPADRFTPSTEAMALFRKMGEWNIENGRWKAAADQFAVLVQVNQVDKSDRTDAATRDLLLAAPLLIESGDTAGYDRIRLMALTRLSGTTNPIAAEHLIKISTLMPIDAVLLRRLEPLAQVASESLTNSDPQINGGPSFEAWRALALGMLDYRRGDYASAQRWVQKSLGYPDTPPQSRLVITHVLLGVVYRNLGQEDKSADELREADKMIKHYFAVNSPVNIYDWELDSLQMGWLTDWLIARQLLNEANASTNSARLPSQTPTAR